MADFIDFINDEILLASRPLFSREALKVYVEKKERNHLKKKMKSYASNTTGKVQEEKDDIKEMKCPVCVEKHDLDNCKQFSKMSVDGRSKMLRRKRLCYGCYLPVSAEHIAKTCKERSVCKICAMKHPTGVHGYVRDGKLMEQLTIAKMVIVILQKQLCRNGCEISKHGIKNHQYVCCSN